MASQDIWIWHTFFDIAGSHNDIDVLQRSPVFVRLAEGNFPEVNVEINGHYYNKRHYLADGERRKRFAQAQESARKDVERAFGVLQSQWGIIQYPARTWSTEKLWEVMTARVIMHNMIVENEHPDEIYDQVFQFQGDNVVSEHGGVTTFAQFTKFYHQMRD
ncbi:hypothetical protein ACQJBY_030094 [Aegilops geniculata]